MAVGYRRTKKGGVEVNWNGDEVERRAKVLSEKSSFEIGLVVEGQAKLLCPVDSGRLRGSITTVSYGNQRTSPKGKGSQPTDVIRKPDEPGETYVGTPVEYAAYVEYGTVRMSAQPYLRPALDIAKGRVPAIMQKEAKKEFADYLNPKDLFSQMSYGESE